MDRLAEFGRRVREVRNSLGLSQETLAQLANLHRTYVGDIERGERNVSLLNIWKLATALSIHPSALFPVSQTRVRAVAQKARSREALRFRSSSAK